jgi:hypothetical protein
LGFALGLIIRRRRKETTRRAVWSHTSIGSPFCLPHQKQEEVTQNAKTYISDNLTAPGPVGAGV